MKVTNTEVGVTNLRLKYPGDGSLLFKGLSFSVRKGEKVLLLGPSGCGKSTLLQVLSGIVPGIVEIPMKADELLVPERPGYVFQDPDTQFCMPYVDEEVAFVLENQGIAREKMPALIRRYLEMVGLRLEDVHTPIGQLSQGMKQRLAIAGVLALQPDVMFLDEPTALLDEEGTREVWETIRKAAAGQTLLIVEHKIGGILDLVDRVVVFAPDGQIIGDGTPHAVFQEYRQKLLKYGIWYPGIWDDYERSKEGSAASQAPAVHADGTAPLLRMDGFQGLRGGGVKIRVDHASVKPGEWIAVVGRNGAGKSSLLLAIMRLIRTKGTCEVAGAPGMKVEQLAEKIAFVFQNPEFQFVTHSVEEELAYSLPDSSDVKNRREEIVDRLLREYDLTELRKRHPFQLSMGQKRRLSVATALVRGQRILLLDEPTFGLDARNTFQLLEQLEQLRREGTAILMVTHDPQIVRKFATRVWRVEYGMIAETLKAAESDSDVTALIPEKVGGPYANSVSLS